MVFQAGFFNLLNWAPGITGPSPSSVGEQRQGDDRQLAEDLEHGDQGGPHEQEVCLRPACPTQRLPRPHVQGPYSNENHVQGPYSIDMNVGSKKSLKIPFCEISDQPIF